MQIRSSLLFVLLSGSLVSCLAHPPTVSEAQSNAERNGRTLWIGDDGLARDNTHRYKTIPDEYETERFAHDHAVESDAHEHGFHVLDLSKLRIDWAKQIFISDGGAAKEWMKHLTEKQQRALRARALLLVSEHVDSLPKKGVTETLIKTAAKACHDKVVPELKALYLKYRHRNEYAEYAKGLPHGHQASVPHTWHSEERIAAERRSSDPINGADGVADISQAEAKNAEDSLTDPVLSGNIEAVKTDAKESANAVRNAALKSDPMMDDSDGQGQVEETETETDHAKEEAEKTAEASKAEEDTGSEGVGSEATSTSTSSSSGKKTLFKDPVANIGTLPAAARHAANAWHAAVKKAWEGQAHAEKERQKLLSSYYKNLHENYMNQYKGAVKQWKKHADAVKAHNQQFAQLYNQQYYGGF